MLEGPRLRLISRLTIKSACDSTAQTYCHRYVSLMCAYGMVFLFIMAAHRDTQAKSASLNFVIRWYPRTQTYMSVCTCCMNRIKVNVLFAEKAGRLWRCTQKVSFSEEMHTYPLHPVFQVLRKGTVADMSQKIIFFGVSGKERSFQPSNAPLYNVEAKELESQLATCAPAGSGGACKLVIIMIWLTVFFISNLSLLALWFQQRRHHHSRVLMF